MDSVYSDIAYDDAFRTAETKCDDLLIPFVNYSVIISLIHKVAYKMTMKRENVQRKVGDIMGGKVLDLEVIKAHREGIEEGETRGEARGLAKSVVRLAEHYMSQDPTLERSKAIEMATKILG